MAKQEKKVEKHTEKAEKLKKADEEKRMKEFIELVKEAENKTGCTVRVDPNSPLSNLKLRVVDKLENHPLKRMMNKNLLVTINSDDPAYFGGQLKDRKSVV